MAAVTPIFKPAKPAPDPQEEKLKRVLEDIQRARTDRDRHRPRIEACYRFAMPWRHSIGMEQPTDQLDQIFTDLAMTVTEDFAADMINTFTPMKEEWLEVKPAITLQDKGDQKLVADQLKRYQEVVFGEITRSNFYQAAQECYLDLAIGTMAVCIKDIGASEPIHCEAVPTTELLLNRGRYGRVCGTWREWTKMRGEDIGGLWPDAKTSKDKPQDKAFEDDDYKEYNVIDGLWRTWDKPAQETWKYVVLVEKNIVCEETYKGRGSNPMIVARWSRDSTTAWGVGPLYRTSPSVKVLNYLQKHELEAIDKAINPVTSYEDDGVMNLDHGIEAGLWIPRANGSKPPEVIESKAKFEVSFAKREDLEHDIKRAHYQDRPEQIGKTPPTATQWQDERAERARRMGTPATGLVHDWQYGVFYRFAYLLEKRGLLPKVELNGEAIAVEPISPLLRAQQQEVVVRRSRLVELMAPLGPQITAVVINAARYATLQGRDLGVENIVNSEAEIAAAIKQFGELVKSAQAGQIPGQAPGQVL